MNLQAPHQTIRTRDKKEKFLVDLFDALYVRYRSRMEFVRKYEEVVKTHGAVFINDHIAFRTLACQSPMAGIFMISRVFEALGYSAANAYEFPDKHLSSIHYQHLNPQFPKLFITQLKSWKLSLPSRKIISSVLASHRPFLSDNFLSSLSGLEDSSASDRKKALKILVRYFEELPWDLPQKKEVLALDKESQYGAWVLVNGYEVNHFTASVDSHKVQSLNDIEKLIDKMKKAEIPMKKEIEGERGSKLRQSSTESVVLQVSVKDGTQTISMPWPYAYFEIAERPLIKNPITGTLERFEGFLGSQAANLFEMTAHPKGQTLKIGT